ncbi:hypothetical protein C9J03_02315 [Photobacterium gaetbulicola]|uniref:Uncharacterized protein n=1 Tax=Photobacterium gaetbulicola Gung47 TaxID=658445 RepID=A0A0C5WQN6_9GAMM|nr:hypothetical protein [Photobacterium gaetbulicola]AJR09483.1 hypothetical protein H744_2c2830 [Photobacterium gaetbulicola Gung47]PSU14277.1 hypothetical protein C9J03_02315 [Photobacterium gaetbulicola]
MDRFVSIAALIHHLRAEKPEVDPEHLITLVALGAQSAKLLHLLKASGQPLGTIPSVRLQQELSLYGQQRFDSLAEELTLKRLLPLIHPHSTTSPYWLTPWAMQSLHTHPDWLFLMYYFEYSWYAINDGHLILDSLWQWHQTRALTLICYQLLMDSGQWDAIYGNAVEIIAIDHKRKRCLVMSQSPIERNQLGYHHEWRPLDHRYLERLCHGT